MCLRVTCGRAPVLRQIGRRIATDKMIMCLILLLLLGVLGIIVAKVTLVSSSLVLSLWWPLVSPLLSLSLKQTTRREVPACAVVPCAVGACLRAPTVCLHQGGEQRSARKHVWKRIACFSTHTNMPQAANLMPSDGDAEPIDCALDFTQTTKKCLEQVWV